MKGVPDGRVQKDLAAEAAYANACRHWKRCPTCTVAGGEEADPRRLCIAGRMLSAVWTKAEKIAAKEHARMERLPPGR